MVSSDKERQEVLNDVYLDEIKRKAEIYWSHPVDTILLVEEVDSLRRQIKELERALEELKFGTRK